jgi:hypothetical protein
MNENLINILRNKMLPLLLFKSSFLIKILFFSSGRDLGIFDGGMTSHMEL